MSIHDFELVTPDPEATCALACRLVPTTRHWATLAWQASPPRDINTLAARLGDDAFSRALAALDYALYAQCAEVWRGRQFWRKARRVLKPPLHEAAAVDPLPPLYG